MMPRERTDRLHATHILEAGGRIETYLRGIDAAAFEADQLRIDAVVRNFQVIGEAAKRISAQTREGHPEVPWRELARFRDVLVHRYDEILPAEVWRIATESLPPALQTLRSMMSTKGWV